jgi:ferritin
MKPKKLNETLCKLIEERLVDEYKAFYTYQAISNWARGVGFMKAGDYFKKESDDELVHARKLEDFLTDWNDIPQLPVIKQPELEFKTLLEAIETAYGLELALYEAYGDVCSEVFEKDPAVYQFISQFLEIQTKSVAEYSDFLNIIEGCDGSDKFQMLLLENKLFS